METCNATEMELAKLTDVEISRTPVGVSFFNKNGSKLIIMKTPEGSIRACENICKHQGGTFIKSDDIEDIGKNIVKCVRHYWKLDCETFTYVNPPNIHKQDEIRVEPVLDADGGVRFLKSTALYPWSDIQPYLDLQTEELAVTYLSHACMEFKLGERLLVSDPWLTGPAFLRGWWLSHKPPEDAIERVCKADAIWISHSHSDHLNIPTLRLIATRKPDILIFVADLAQPVIKAEIITELGLTNVQIVPIGKWQPFGDHARFMINGDNTLPEIDTWILIEYKGHRIVNFVDCSAPSSFQLPNINIDLLLTDFASGASGFPSCFSEMHGEDKIICIADSKRKMFLRKLGDLAKLTNAKSYFPVAGYFTAAHPSDADVNRLNKQNSPQEAIHYISDHHSSIKTWLPFPGGTFDLATLSGPPSPPEIAFLETNWNFNEYVGRIERESAQMMTSMDSIIEYFKRVGFCDYELILHVIETNETFDNVVREFYVDFSPKNAAVVSTKRIEGRNYFRMRVRSTSFRYVLHKFLSWDDLYIGFQARFKVEPDIYHFKFLNHFSNIKNYESKEDTNLKQIHTDSVSDGHFPEYALLCAVLICVVSVALYRFWFF